MKCGIIGELFHELTNPRDQLGKPIKRIRGEKKKLRPRKNDEKGMGGRGKEESTRELGEKREWGKRMRKGWKGGEYALCKGIGGKEGMGKEDEKGMEGGGGKYEEIEGKEGMGGNRVGYREKRERGWIKVIAIVELGCGRGRIVKTSER